MKFKLGQHVIAKEDFEAERRMSDGNRKIIFKVADVKKGQEAIVTGQLQNTLTLFLILDYGLVVPLDEEHFDEKPPGREWTASIHPPAQCYSKEEVRELYGSEMGCHLLNEEPPVTEFTPDKNYPAVPTRCQKCGEVHIGSFLDANGICEKCWSES